MKKKFANHYSKNETSIFDSENEAKGRRLKNGQKRRF